MGSLSNVHRNQQIEKTRHHFGKGVYLLMVEGVVRLHCLSDVGIFVQNPLTNLTCGWLVDTVCKVPTNCEMVVLDNQFFNFMRRSFFVGDFFFFFFPFCFVCYVLINALVIPSKIGISSLV